VIPEIWWGLSRPQQQKEIARWAIEGPKLAEARKKRGFHCVHPDDEVEYNQTLAEARAKHKVPEVPAMPCIPLAMIAVRPKAEQLYEHVAHVGFAVPASQQLSVQDLGMRAYSSENTKSSSSKTVA